MRRVLAGFIGLLAATAATEGIAEPRTSADPFDSAFWQAVTADRECETVRAYLMRFPNGAYVDLAAMEERRRCGNAAAAVVLAAPTPSVVLLPDPAPSTSEPTPAPTVPVTLPPAIPNAPAILAAPTIATPAGPASAEPGPIVSKPTEHARHAAHTQERPEHGRGARQHAPYMDEPIEISPHGPVGPYGFGMRHAGLGMALAPALINRPGESYMYVGNMRCRTLGRGRPQVICP